MRRAQFEIMGLAVIVVIISVAIFFFLSFSLTPEPDLTRQFQEEQFSQNALTAWLSSDIEGCSRDIKGYVARYASGSLSGSACESEALMETLSAELERMLERYPVITSYNLSVRYGVCDGITAIGEGCEEVYTLGDCDPRAPGARNARPGREVLPLSPIPGSAEVVLFGCAG